MRVPRLDEISENSEVLMEGSVESSTECERKAVAAARV